MEGFIPGKRSLCTPTSGAAGGEWKWEGGEGGAVKSEHRGHEVGLDLVLPGPATQGSVGRNDLGPKGQKGLVSCRR